MKDVIYQIQDPSDGQWLTVNERAFNAMKKEGWGAVKFINVDELKPLVDLVQNAQTALTEHLSPTGPSKGDTIDALNTLLLGPASHQALRPVWGVQ